MSDLEKNSKLNDFMRLFRSFRGVIRNKDSAVLDVRNPLGQNTTWKHKI